MPLSASVSRAREGVNAKASRIALACFVFFFLTVFASVTAQKAHAVKATQAFYALQGVAFAYAAASSFAPATAPRTCWKGAAHAVVLSSFVWAGVTAAVAAEFDAAEVRWPWVALATNAWAGALALFAYVACIAFANERKASVAREG